MNRTEAQPLQPDAGFSLLDALVALAITGMVSVAVFSSVQFVQQAQVRMALTNTRIESILAVDRLMRGVLEHGAYYPRQTVIPGFRGEPHLMELLSSGPESLLAEQIMPVRLVVRAGADGVALDLGWAEPGGEQKSETIPLKLTAMTFSYFGSPERDTREVWAAAWTRADIVPRGVSVELEFPEGAPPLQLVYKFLPTPLPWCLSRRCAYAEAQP